MENIPKAPEIEIDMNSNNAPGFIMKLALILVMIIVVVFIVRIGIAMVFYFNSPDKSPYLIDGMVPGNEARTIEQNPALKNSITINRSKNEMSGMEFTWSVWLWVKSGETNFEINQSKLWKHIFHKGNDSIISRTDARPSYSDDENADDGTSRLYYESKDLGNEYLINYDYGYDMGMAWPNNSPGLYLDSTNNALRFILSTYPMTAQYSMVTSHDVDGNVNMIQGENSNLAQSNNQGVIYDSDVQIKEEIDISNIPLDKWVCLVLRVKNNVIDIYVNGVITNRHYALGVIKQNTYDVHTGQNGGFDGYISRLKYDNKALSAVEIQDLYKKGPKTKFVSKNTEPEFGKISNLSNKWYGN